jgi:CRISPR-associated endoribonuclease Cas6
MNDLKSAFADLRFEKFVFEVKPQSAIIFPSYKGVTLRGAFGKSLKRLFCVEKKSKKSCSECLLNQSCSYSYIFESPNIKKEPYFLSPNSSVPHPFVLEPPLDAKRHYQPGETFSFGLILVGKALRYLPSIVYSFVEIGKKGLGVERGKFSLVNVYSVQKEKKVVIFDSRKECFLNVSFTSKRDFPYGEEMKKTDTLKLEFLTPVRIVKEGKPLKNLEFWNIINALLIRLAQLMYFHCGEKPEIDIQKLVDESRGVKVVESQLYWSEFAHFSPRIRERIKLGGLLGDITFKGKLDKWYPILKLGEILHLGKATSFGFGKYTVGGK